MVSDVKRDGLALRGEDEGACEKMMCACGGVIAWGVGYCGVTGPPGHSGIQQDESCEAEMP